MISNILKAKDRWLSVDLNNSYQASLKYEKRLSFITIEEALTLWVENALQVGLNISDDIDNYVTKEIPVSLFLYIKVIHII